MALTKHVLPVLLVLFLSPLPKKLGFYEYLFSKFPPEMGVGVLPCSIASKDSWGFTPEDLYGDGPSGDADDIEAYRNRLWGQNAMVTGANSGLGFEISLALARLGANVAMACRNPLKCSAAASRIRYDDLVRERAFLHRGGRVPRITTHPVDLSSLTSVRNFCGGFLAGNGTETVLDMVFLNAGILNVAPSEDGSAAVTEDGIETVFATNVVGHHFLYKLLVEQQTAAKRKTPLRIVLTSSSMSYGTKHPFKVPTDLEQLNGVPPVDGFTHYSESKLAQVLWVQEATARLDAASGGGDEDEEDPNAVVYANAAHPGGVATNLHHDGIHYDSLGLPSRLTEVVFKATPRWTSWRPEEGALTLLYLGTAVGDLRQQNIRGQFFAPQTRWIRDHRDASAGDPGTKILREKLWKFLDELVADFV